MRAAGNHDRFVSAGYWDIIDAAKGVLMWVDFTTDRGTVVDYTVMLALPTPGGIQTIRVYDAAHGFNEMHRYTQRSGKQKGVEVHRGTLGEGMRAAISDLKNGYLAMIEGWKG